MDVLVPIDGTEASERALTFAADLAAGLGASLHVVHVTGTETETATDILDRAKELLAAKGLDDDPQLETRGDLDFRPAEDIGETIVELVEANNYDHVVMGHYPREGAVERAIVGSTARTVVEAGVVPVTVVP